MAAKYHLKTCVFSLSLCLWSLNVLAEDICYKVDIKQKIDTAKCEEVPVILKVFECGSGKAIDEKELNSKFECNSPKPKLTTNYAGKILVSNLEPAEMWGGINFKAIKTVEATDEKNPVIKKKKNRQQAVVPVEIKEAKNFQTPVENTERKPEVSAVTASPLVVKVSGLAWVEYERSSLFGYNGTSGLNNFDSAVANQQDFSTLLSNIQVDISKDKTTLTSIFEVGEMIGGEAVTGGFQGGRQRVLEVRDMFLAHEFNSNWTLRAGLMNMASDPNAYILSDHHSALWLDYKQDAISASIWTAKAKEVKPGSSPSTTPVSPTLPAQSNPIYPDTYAGFTFSSPLSESAKFTGYGVYRKTREAFNDENGKSGLGASEYYWEGVTADQILTDRFGVQLSAILNQGKFRAEAADVADTLAAYLADAKLTVSLKEQGWDFLLEGLTTSGGTEAPVIGKRKAFSSPDPGAAYLLTIATSDGADDAPGSLKESIIGNLAQNEGLQIGVLKATKTITEKLSGFIRLGYLRSSAKNLTTNSQEMGQEYDLNLSYEMSPGTQLFFDYGYFKPGSFYSNNEAAQLFTTRLKFTF